jgi:RNA-directed DNA polymerase
LSFSIKRTLKVPAYLRYMDDFTLFGDDRQALEEAREAIREWLWRERHLELNPRHDSVEPTAQPGTFLGYRVSRSGLLPGPKAKRRLRQRLRQVDALGLERLARGLRAYRGVLLTLG